MWNGSEGGRFFLVVNARQVVAAEDNSLVCAVPQFSIATPPCSPKRVKIRVEPKVFHIFTPPRGTARAENRVVDVNGDTSPGTRTWPHPTPPPVTAREEFGSFGKLGESAERCCDKSQSNKRREVVEKQKQNKFSAGGPQVPGYEGRRGKWPRLRQSWSQPSSGQQDSLSGLASFMGRGRSVDASSPGGSSANSIKRYRIRSRSDFSNMTTRSHPSLQSANHVFAGQIKKEKQSGTSTACEWTSALSWLTRPWVGPFPALRGNIVRKSCA